MNEKRINEQLETIKNFSESLAIVRKEYFNLSPEVSELHEMIEWTDEQHERYRLLTLAQKSLLVEWSELEHNIGKHYSVLNNFVDVDKAIREYINNNKQGE